MIYEIQLQNYAKIYVDKFIYYINNSNISITIEESYYLLDYVIRSVYSLECPWYTDSIRMYGSVAIQDMNTLVVPDYTLTYEDRESLARLCNSYFVAYTGIAV